MPEENSWIQSNRFEVESALRCLFAHYECEYAVVKLYDIRYSHGVFAVFRADSPIMKFTEPAMRVRVERLCLLTLDRPIPVIVSPLPDSESRCECEQSITAFVGVPVIIRGDYVGGIGMVWTSRPCNSSIFAYTAADEVARAIGALLEN
jgi:hypothetical protein